MERTGPRQHGTITGFYTVLVDDDMNEPIADAVRGILDGHIILSRRLAERQHYPAIDVLASVSRVMPDVTEKEHQSLMGELKTLLAVYRDNEDLINIGAYVKGSNPLVDRSIEYVEQINAFLRQGTHEEAVGIRLSNIFVRSFPLNGGLLMRKFQFRLERVRKYRCF